MARDFPRVHRHADSTICGAARTIGGMSRAATLSEPSACRSGEADIRPTFRRERAALKRGIWPVAGCDEPGGDRSPVRSSPPR